MRHLHENFPSKPVLILINKCDLVPPEAVGAWKTWFKETYPFANVSTLKSWGDIRTESIEVKQTKLNETKTLLTDVVSQIMEIAESMEVTLTHNDFQYMNYDLDEDNNDEEEEEEEEVLPLEDSENGNEFVISVIGQPNVGKS